MDIDFKVFHSKDAKTRTNQYQTVAVKVMGRTQDGMHWVNDNMCQNIIIPELSFTEIKLDLGEPEPTFTTESGLFTYKKYSDEQHSQKYILVKILKI